VVDGQDSLIQKAIHKSTKIKIASDLENRYTLLDNTGLEKAKAFLQQQKDIIKKGKIQFVGHYIIVRRKPRICSYPLIRGLIKSAKI